MNKLFSRIFANKALGVAFSVLVVVAAIGGYQALNKYYTFGVSAPKAAEGECLDSDGGAVYEQAGTVTLSTDQTQSGDDFCYPDSGPGGLLEYYCRNGLISRSLYHCPNGCSNGACIQIPTAALTVLSPNGGERWPLGSTQKIRWSDDGKSGYAVYVTDRSGSAHGLLGVVQTGTELEWSVGDLKGDSLAPGEYYIQVINQDGSDETDQSDASFTISAR